MRIALDATYGIARQPSGVAVYSREILAGLPKLFPQDEYLHAYRWRQWHQSGRRGRLLLPPLPTFRAGIFHALNQRVDRRPARRVVTTFHDLFVLTSEYSAREFRERFAKQARTAAANSDLIVAVSQFSAAQVEELLKVPAGRIRVIPHGTRPPARARISSEFPFVLSVGTIQSRKNTGRLVSAFEILPPPWRLILAGAPDGYGADEILRQIRNSPSVSRIEVTGYVSAERLCELYAAASVFAFPSLGEGFGLPVLEAMANEVPVLTSNTSALKEIAEGAAVLVDPLSINEIADALLWLANNHAWREGLVQTGKKRSLSYTWDRAVRSTHAVYRELLM